MTSDLTWVKTCCLPQGNCGAGPWLCTEADISPWHWEVPVRGLLTWVNLSVQSACKAGEVSWDDSTKHSQAVLLPGAQGGEAE